MTERSQARKPVKLAWKIFLDVAMCLVLVLLYKAKVLTLTYHEVAGIAILAFFLIHCLFNKAWIVKSTKRLFSPSLPLRTKISYWLSVLLVICFLVIVFSGICISKVLFRDLLESSGISDNASLFRTLHLFFSALSLILVGAHVGLYWDIVKGFAAKHVNMPAKIARPLSIVVLAVMLAFGAYSLPTSGFASWLACPVIPISHGDKSKAAEGEEADRASDGEAADRTTEGNATDGEATSGTSGNEAKGETSEGENATKSETTSEAEANSSSGSSEGGDARTNASSAGGEVIEDEANNETTEGASTSERSSEGRPESADAASSDARDASAASGEQLGQTDQAEQSQNSDQADPDAQTERSGQSGQTSDSGKGSSGNHGTNVTLGGTLYVIAQFTCIIALFATLTYWIDRILKKRGKASRAQKAPKAS